jgi:hypothetical protein
MLVVEWTKARRLMSAKAGQWMLALGPWMLALGPWMLVLGPWMLALVHQLM